VTAAAAIITAMLLEAILVYFSVRWHLAVHFLQDVRGQMIVAAYEHLLTGVDDSDWRIDEFHKIKFWRLVINYHTFKPEYYWDDTSFLDPNLSSDSYKRSD
jgi:hypothetical protein